MDELIEYSFQKEESSQQDDVVSVFLTLSYRGHPSFLLMPSRLFYFDKLRSIYKEKGGFIDDNDALNNWCRILRKVESLSDSVDQNNVDVVKQTSWPIHFRGVIGKDTSVAVESFWGSNSWSNLEEAKAVLEIVQQLCQKEGVSTQSIGVMAAFRAQVVLIRKLLREHNLGSVNVGMVEDYQAVERHVIVLSLTRSNEVFLAKDVERRAGLFRQPKRINVALTRAEHLLIVIGNPVTMGNEPIWKEWLLFCYQNGLWYGEQGDTDLPSNIKNIKNPENIDARLREKGTQQYKAALLQNGSK
jgi:superfamily I DNA and/or RNA helicase